MHVAEFIHMLMHHDVNNNIITYSGDKLSRSFYIQQNIRTASQEKKNHQITTSSLMT